MRAKFFLTIIISYISIIFADSTTISGTIKDYHSNIPLSNVEIIITRIGDSVSVNDTVISNSSGLYTFNYQFELENYKKKYYQIRVEPLNNSTHWFHAERYNYTYKGQTSANLVGISNTMPDSSKVIGTVSYSHSSTPYFDEYEIIFTQTNEDSTEIKIDTIKVGINDLYTFYVNIKKFKHFKMDLSSNKWNIRESLYSYWDYLSSYPVFDHFAKPVDADAVRLSGKVNIIGNEDPYIYLSDGAGEDIKIFSKGYFSHYVPKGWSGTLKLLASNYSLISDEPTLTNVQEDQILNLTIKRNTHTVNGCVSIDKGDSVKNVLIDFGTDYTITDSLGFYSIEMSHNNPFEIFPYKEGYTFNPNNLTDLTCTSDITMNLTAIATKEVTINGTINTGNRGDVDSVLILFSGTGNGNCWTDANGNFSHTLRYDWSGTITPVKQEKVFNPPLISVEDLDNDTIISSIKIEDPITETSIYEKPVNLNKFIKSEFEIVVFNTSGRLIGKAKNIKVAEMLTKNAPGLYIYKRIVKSNTIKTQNCVFIR